MPAPGATVTQTLPIIETRDGRVVCYGLFQCADKKGRHDLLQPVFHLAELTIAPGNSPKVGDLIDQYTDGTLQHRVGPPQAAGP